jgi:hypothetical protein
MNSRLQAQDRSVQNANQDNSSVWTEGKGWHVCHMVLGGRDCAVRLASLSLEGACPKATSVLTTSMAV